MSEEEIQNVDSESEEDDEHEEPVIVDLLSLLDEVDEIELPPLAPAVLNTVAPVVKVENSEPVHAEKLPAKDPKQTKLILEISKSSRGQTGITEWAEEIDVTEDVANFDQLIPDPAYRWPFQLDTFQKQAILKLEDDNHVFVAAHTSAGKTVVAEYAIALSQRHSTRTVYTSPIKALSNQKYRDFQTTFKDVGLITGDIQLNPTAMCLIMTTEILLSMLYNQNDVTRDIEYVIFDEVHYLNDAERGHVWEEVLILLPEHVKIVMLSATVPNTLEFGNWVGQTKKKKVYVISTPKRPVPLKHFLYTGCGGKTRDDIFLVVDADGEFEMSGYLAAVEAKKGKPEKPKATDSRRQPPPKKRPPPPTARSDQTLWVGLVDHLKRKDMLPAVAFTLSRNRCDTNAQSLVRSVDLCTAREKGKIHQFFTKCMLKLNPADRELPQVRNMAQFLSRGFGVHHSGILPILKEIVEMLFQHGLVKLLFATETFAMGVNMPARTVVFDSCQKYDGRERRALKPAEYIQMAGRAGRRGLDSNGTVIVLCKQDVPTANDLKLMMLGKPTRLESQFRLTYSTILNLLRVDSIRVEDIMSHSFREVNKELSKSANQRKLAALQEQLDSLPPANVFGVTQAAFYDAANEMFNKLDKVMPYIISQKISKYLKTGRVLTVCFESPYLKHGIYLKTKTGKHLVLVLDDIKKDEENEGSVSNAKPTIATQSKHLWNRMLSLLPQYQSYNPDGIGGHKILEITEKDIVDLSETVIKVDADVIIQNVLQRQIPRFKDSPPGPSVVKAVAELNELNTAVSMGTKPLEYVNLFQDLAVDLQNGDILSMSKEIVQLKFRLKKMTSSAPPNFEKDFTEVFTKKDLERQRDRLQYLISYESLSLYPDFVNKLKVLKDLKFIDEQEEVTLRGRVACEMSTNELVLTDLVLNNTFTELQPAEIAALLSSLVFQAKTEVTPNINKTLQEGKLAIEQIDNEITKVELQYNVSDAIVDRTNTQSSNRLNFGLVEVVYEWANQKPFSEIIECTDIQEGIIVRCIQQLNELIGHLKDASRIIGDPILHTKMEEASNAIQRDIVFAASLYTQQEKISMDIEEVNE